MNPPVSRDSGGFGFLDWNEKQSSLIETACRFARGFVVELLSQGQMTGLCT